MRRIVLSILVLAVAAPVWAQVRRADPLRFVTWPIEDARGLVAGFSRGELLATAAGGGALILFSRFDRQLTEDMAGITEGTHVAVIEEFGNVKVVRPMAAALFLGALMSGSETFQDAAFTSLEAVVFGNLVTNVLKSAFGRARPFEEQGPSAFSPFSGGTSFPSGHSTTAFAFMTPWFLYYPGPLTGGLLVLATATAFSRMATNVHWFSDVVGGSAVGFVTAYALTRRHTGRKGFRITPSMGPAGVGLEMRF